MPISIAKVLTNVRSAAVPGLCILVAYPGLHAQDTSLTRQQLAAHADAANAAIEKSGIAALFASARPATVLEFPGLAVGHPDAELRRQADSRYSGSTVKLALQHVLVSSDGLLGCAIGLTRLRLALDKEPSWRTGRYVSCWRRTTRTGPWTLLVHAQGGEREGSGPLDAGLRGPHSATRRGDGNDARAALAADASFAKCSADSGAGVAFPRFAAVDGMLLGERPRPLQGRDEIGQAFGPKVEGSSVTWRALPELAVGTGGLALTMGEAVHRDGGQESRTKYLSIWRLEDDGSWRYVIDLGSPRP